MVYSLCRNRGFEFPLNWPNKKVPSKKDTPVWRVPMQLGEIDEPTIFHTSDVV